MLNINEDVTEHVALLFFFCSKPAISNSAQVLYIGVHKVCSCRVSE